MDREWGHLPYPVLKVLFQKIHVKDLLSFCMVCQKWHEIGREDITKLTMLNQHHLVPKLLVPNEDDDTNTKWTVFNTTKETDPISLVTSSLVLPPYTLPFIGSSQGWLCTLRADYKLTLYKPFMHTIDIFLPSPVLLPRENLSFDIIKKFTTYTLDTISKPHTFLMAIIFGQPCQVAYIRPFRDPSWTTMPDIPEVCRFSYDDILFHRGAFYGVDHHTGGMACFNISDDLSTLTFRWFHGIQPDETRDWARKYLVESCDGRDILQIQRFRKETLNMAVRLTDYFDVFRWNFDQRTWEEVHNIGNQAIFLGDNSSISIDTTTSTECLGNTIYYTDDKGGSGFNIRYPLDMGLFNISTRRMRELGIDRFHLVKMGGRTPIWVQPTIYFREDFC
ncbi:hypothetical protein CsatB_006439 [Cannabis sativa]